MTTTNTTRQVTNQQMVLQVGVERQMVPAHTLRWLHLSDFHVGKDDYGQVKLFGHILKNIREKVQAGTGPDVVFITGDIAHSGNPVEYKLFTDEFFRPLLATVGYSDRVFIIPGNHDLDRKKAVVAARYDAPDVAPHLFDTTANGAEHRKSLLPRFDAYVNAAMSKLVPPVSSHWLYTSEGVYTHTLTIRDLTIGILGLNTAWLAKGGEEDRYKMSPGKLLVEAGLEKLANCDLTIVLGHHPIDWFRNDEVDSFRSLFGDAHVMYLHGHLHRADGRHAEDGGKPFLPIQAGASFQVRADERWVSQMLWCELDYFRRTVKVEPLTWSKDWVIATDEFPPPNQKAYAKRWQLRLPGSSGESLDAPDEGIPDLPQAWIYIYKQFLEREASKTLESEQVIRFFDGSYPSWQTVLSSNIKPLTTVASLQDILEKARLKSGPGVTVLLGPGGEGKTTVLKQVVCNLVNASSAWRILWRDDEDSNAPLDFLLELPDIEGATWLVVSDEAGNIADRVFGLVKSLWKQGRKDIQFLLCCRDTDWMAVNADRPNWAGFTMHYAKKMLSGLTEEDARRVVENWRGYGDQGLRELARYPFDTAVDRLVKAAQSKSLSKEGSFLGAMLEVRLGEGLKDHVKEILERLNKVAAPGGTLLEAFTYIAALHSKNAELISKEILALRLDCEPDEIKPRVIGPLGQEAPITRDGKYFLTRHSRIARTAVEILAESPFNYDVEEKYIINLVRFVIRMHKLDPDSLKDEIRKWRYLSSDIFNLVPEDMDRTKRNEEVKHNKDLAIRLARALVDEDESDGHFLVNLAQMLWRVGKPEKGAELFRNPSKKVRKDRAYYFAWGVAEGRAQNHALDAWLGGVSLADGIEEARPDHERIRKSLQGLSTAFSKLFEKNHISIFSRACAAAAQLGLEAWPDPKTKVSLEDMLAKYRAKGVQEVSLSVAFHWLEEGILAAWQQREVELEGLMRGDQLTFHGLSRALNI
jgi:hypothetical protein